MYAAITNGANLVFRWMGIWLACNLITGALIRLDIWTKRRRAKKARRMLQDGRQRVVAVVRETETQIIVQDEDGPETGTAREIGTAQETVSEKDADTDMNADEKAESASESDANADTPH